MPLSGRLGTYPILDAPEGPTTPGRRETDPANLGTFAG